MGEKQKNKNKVDSCTKLHYYLIIKCLTQQIFKDYINVAQLLISWFVFPNVFCLFSLNQGEGTVHLTVCWFAQSESRPTAERDIVPSDLTTPVLRSASVLFSTLSVRPLTTNWDVLGWNCVCLTSALEFALSVLCLSFLVYVGWVDGCTCVLT